MSGFLPTPISYFGHKNILKYQPQRGFDSVEDMDQALIDNWNAVVAPEDTVWFLGDFALCKASYAEYCFRSLNGNICWIKGNHDSHKFIKSLSLDFWSNYHELHEPHRIVMCHYPILSWNGAHRGTWMLHGHTHGNLEDKGITRFDVGIDNHPELRPFSFEEIQEIMKDRTYLPVDHHKKDR